MPSQESPSEIDVVRLCAIRDTPLSVDEVLAPVPGRVRDHDHDRVVDSLGYQAHPQAGEQMAQICARVAAAHDVRAVAAVHRVGELAIGDIAVITAVAAAHRGAAFAAGHALIDELKAGTPIWKNQHFADGAREWVGLP